MDNNTTQRASQIKLLGLDVDGTLTDGTITVSGGQFVRSFSVLDGQGIKTLQQLGVKVAIITAAKKQYGVADIELRAQSLGINLLYTDVTDKLAVLKEIIDANGITLPQVAYMGDDLADLSVMQAVGLSACPSTAVGEVLAQVHFIAQRPAGLGAVRQFCDEIKQAIEHGTA